MAALQALNLGVRFALELCALALVSYVAYRLLGGSGWPTAAAVVAPVLFAAAWGAFAAPRAVVPLPEPWKTSLQVLLLLLPAAGLLQVGRTGWAGVYGSAVLANATLMAWWEQ